MIHTIGFHAEYEEPEQTVPDGRAEIQAKKSVVQVRFWKNGGRTLSYYNDRFDLHKGDIVFVDGKLSGQQGIVTDVNYSFKIRLSDYKRVIAVADTHVSGQLYFAGAYFAAFDSGVLSRKQVSGWFCAPLEEGDEFVSATDEDSFALKNCIQGLGVSAAIAERGIDYYRDGNVLYLSVDGEHGYAIVEGTEPYELEFTYRGGEVSGLLCSCFCSYHCKHEVAAMLQLKDLLEFITEHYAEQYERTHYFAAIDRSLLFRYAVDNREAGSLVLNP